MATRLKKTNLHHSRILRHIGSRELCKRSGYYKHTWYGEWCNIEYAILDSSSDAYVIEKKSMYRK